MSSFLAYGISGLGLALATYTYKLLSTEQRRDRVRDNIVRAIYTYMLFSFALTVAGLLFEYMKITSDPIRSTVSSCENDGIWYDAVKAMREKLFFGQTSSAYVRGIMSNGEVREVPITILNGQCLNYLAMAKSPGSISFTIETNGLLDHKITGADSYFSFGEICNKITSSATNVAGKIKMSGNPGGSCPFVFETYKKI